MKPLTLLSYQLYNKHDKRQRNNGTVNCIYIMTLLIIVNKEKMSRNNQKAKEIKKMGLLLVIAAYLK